ELETDKVNVEVPAEQDGTLTQIVKHEGDTVGIGEVLALIDGGAPAGAAAPAPAAAAAPAETPEQEPAATPAVAAASGNGSAEMLTTFNEIDMTAVMEVRKRRRDGFKERHGVSLGFMSFFTKAVVGALKAFPLLNAEVQGDEIVVKHYYDIGIAVGAEEGLVV